MDASLGRPPPHLEGTLKVQQSNKGKVGRASWRERFILVLKSDLAIHEKAGKRSSSNKVLKTINLTQAQILDAIAENVPVGFSVNWTFRIKFQDETWTFLASDHAEYKFWFDGIVYVKKFWMAKMSEQTAIESGSSPQREEFDMEVTDINGEKRCIRLRKDAKFDDFYSVWNGRQQRRGSSTQSSMRMLHKQASQLWRVDKTDGEFMVSKTEPIYPYVQRGCQLFLLEKCYKLIVLFFGDGDFVAVPVQPTITTAKVANLPLVKEKLIEKDLSSSNVLVKRYLDSNLEIGLKSDDKPLEVFYGLESGVWRRRTDVHAKLFYRKKSGDDFETDNHPRGVDIIHKDVPDLLPVYRTPSQRGKSPIKGMFEGLLKAKQNNGNDDVSTGNHHDNSQGMLSIADDNLERRRHSENEKQSYISESNDKRTSTANGRRMQIKISSRSQIANDKIEQVTKVRSAPIAEPLWNPVAQGEDMAHIQPKPDGISRIEAEKGVFEFALSEEGGRCNKDKVSLVLEQTEISGHMEAKAEVRETSNFRGTYETSREPETPNMVGQSSYGAATAKVRHDAVASPDIKDAPCKDVEDAYGQDELESTTPSKTDTSIPSVNESAPRNAADDLRQEGDSFMLVRARCHQDSENHVRENDITDDKDKAYNEPSAKVHSEISQKQECSDRPEIPSEIKDETRHAGTGKRFAEDSPGNDIKVSGDSRDRKEANHSYFQEKNVSGSSQINSDQSKAQILEIRDGVSGDFDGYEKAIDICFQESKVMSLSNFDGNIDKETTTDESNVCGNGNENTREGLSSSLSRDVDDLEAYLDAEDGEVAARESSDMKNSRVMIAAEKDSGLTVAGNDFNGPGNRSLQNGLQIARRSLENTQAEFERIELARNISEELQEYLQDENSDEESNDTRSEKSLGDFSVLDGIPVVGSTVGMILPTMESSPQITQLATRRYDYAEVGKKVGIMLPTAKYPSETTIVATHSENFSYERHGGIGEGAQILFPMTDTAVSTEEQINKQTNGDDDDDDDDSSVSSIEGFMEGKKTRNLARPKHAKEPDNGGIVEEMSSQPCWKQEKQIENDVTTGSNAPLQEKSSSDQNEGKKGDSNQSKNGEAEAAVKQETPAYETKATAGSSTRRRRAVIKENEYEKEVRLERIRRRRREKERQKRLEEEEEKKRLEEEAKKLEDEVREQEAKKIEEEAASQKEAGHQNKTLEKSNGNGEQVDSEARSMILQVSCGTCESRDLKPIQVVKYREMKKVLRGCTQIGQINHNAIYDYICLTGVHLRNVNGVWHLADDTVFHSESELTDSLDSIKNLTIKSGRDSIASKISREKQVKLNGGICCHWIPGNRGKWRITGFAEEQLELPRNSEDDRLRAIPSPCFGSSTIEASEKENTVDANKEPVAAKLNDMRNTISKKMESAVREVSTTVKDAFASQNSPQEINVPLEVRQVRETYVIPLARSVSAIGQQFLDAPPHRPLQQIGDDSVNTDIGWLVRRGFCTALFTLILHEMKRDSIFTRFIVGRTAKLSLWSLIKEVSQACVEEPVLQEIINVIQNSPFLFDDDLRARNFVCEALNWQNEAFTEKLLVTWFRNFVRLKHIIDKYFDKASIWKRPDREVATVTNETLSILSHMNNFRFNLHADFEHKELVKRIEGQNMAFMLQREPRNVDIDVMTFE